ncbi:hypothetical protein [Croceiramulus getboli]|nr:hypothetical protein P8624_09725 [Flavobacteriaceae bacterium YJPT1-3]
MCTGSKPAPITITVTAFDSNPCQPSLSDGEHQAPPGQSKEFVTKVKKGQTVMFRVGGDIQEITAITEGPGSDIFEQDPSKSNNWTGVIGKLDKEDTREYSVSYSMKANPGESSVLCSVDPKLQMSN